MPIIFAQVNICFQCNIRLDFMNAVCGCKSDVNEIKGVPLPFFSSTKHVTDKEVFSGKTPYKLFAKNFQEKFKVWKFEFDSTEIVLQCIEKKWNIRKCSHNVKQGR